MRVWLITIGESVPVPGSGKLRLMRAGTLARQLTKHGHDVTWWASTFNHARKEHVFQNDTTFAWEGGTVRMLKSKGYRRNVSVARLLDHAAVARRFRSQCQGQQRPDIVLVSLPIIDLARDAVRFGRENGVPVLVDVRDLWPDVLINVLPPRFRWLSRLLLRSLIRDVTFALSECTGIVGVSKEYLNWALRQAGRIGTKDDAMVPLGYVAAQSSRSDLDAARDRLLKMGIDPTKKLCWYVGTFGRYYDLAPVLQAAARVEQSGRTDLQFVISGEGQFGTRWRQMASDIHNVVFTGWLGGDEINWLRTHVAIGLQPYRDGALQGLSNKLFEYLSAGIPVVSSLRGETMDLIERHGCGVTYAAGDIGDCLEKITWMADDDDRRVEMGRRGQKLFVEQFDSRVVFDTLVAHLEAVAQRHGKRPPSNELESESLTPVFCTSGSRAGVPASDSAERITVEQCQQ